MWELNADEVAYEGIRYYSAGLMQTALALDEVPKACPLIQPICTPGYLSCAFGTGLDDPVVPPEAQFAAYNALTCPKRHLLYPGYAHVKRLVMDDKIIDFFCSEMESKARVDSHFRSSRMRGGAEFNTKA